MKRALTISVILLVIFSLNGSIAFSYSHVRGCAALGIFGHFHSNKFSIGYFHYHPISGQGSLINRGQSTAPYTVVCHSMVNPVIADPDTTSCLIPHQGKGLFPIYLLSPPVRSNFIYQGLSSGGIPL